MSTTTAPSNGFFESSVLGQPAGLFVMFFTEMWERFSYYGMRALLVIFLVSTADKGGWEWTTERAMGLYGTYTMGVYLTPVLGGIIADRLLGYRWAVLLGALIMTLGHASMAFETEMFLYIGLGCLMVGNGLFKPNMTSMISNLYKDHPEKKDGAYSIFYMGVNAGAFLGILICGYIGEKISWSWGFGLAGIFMFLGLLQFYFTQGIFGNVGLTPKQSKALKTEEDAVDNTPRKVIIDRLIVVFIFSIFTIFFWAAFEQAGGSMTIFADRYAQRVLTGNAGFIYKVIDALLTVIPVGIITYVLIKLFSKTFKRYSVGNIILAVSFVIIWCIIFWRINREFTADTTEVAATWFGILNSLFIITLAPLFSKWWESKYNLPGAIKFGLGLVLLGLGFGFLAYGSMSIIPGQEVVKVSMVWLILAYLFHTMGELCISPVGLSYVSKLVPAAWIGMMFGVYYLFIAMGNKIAGSMGGMIEEISTKYSLTTFFLIFTAVPIGLGIIITALHPIVKKLMHGVK